MLKTKSYHAANNDRAVAFIDMIQLEKSHKHLLLANLRFLARNYINNTPNIFESLKRYPLSEACMPHIEPLTRTLIAGKQLLGNAKMGAKRTGLVPITANIISTKNNYRNFQSTNCFWFLDIIKTMDKEPDFKNGRCRINTD